MEEEAERVSKKPSSLSSSSRTTSPSPQKSGSSRNLDELEMHLDKASRRRKKKKQPGMNNKRSKPPTPGFDLTKNPGEEKNTVVDFMQSWPELERAVCSRFLWG